MTESTLHARKYSKREVKEALGWGIRCKCVHPIFFYFFFFKLGPVLVLQLANEMSKAQTLTAFHFHTDSVP